MAVAETRPKDRFHDLTLSVPTEEAAMTVCAKWPDKSTEIYTRLMKTFFEK